MIKESEADDHVDVDDERDDDVDENDKFLMLIGIIQLCKSSYN